MIKKYLIDLGIDISLILAGMFGSLLMISKRAAINIRSSVFGIASGTLSANYLTQIAVDFFDLTGKSQYGMAFLLGYFGLKGVETLFDKYVKKEQK